MWAMREINGNHRNCCITQPVRSMPDALIISLSMFGLAIAIVILAIIIIMNTNA